MHAVILAGGKGTRLRPLTDTRPKPLVPFLGEAFAVGLLRRLRDAGCARATVLVGADATPWQPLVAAGASLGIPVRMETEDTPLDTAGAARRLLRRPEPDSREAHRDPRDGELTLVCNGDILTDLDYRELVERHEAAKATVTIALSRVEDTTSFGVVECDADGFVGRFVEKPPPGTLDADTVNAGTYVLSGDALAAFPGDGPLSFEREVFPGLLERGAVLLGVASDAYWQDLGTPERYLAAHRDALDGRCAWPLAPGLRVEAGPAAIHESARLSPDADVGPYSVVGAEVVIGPGARVAGSVLHAGVRVGAEAQLRDVILGERVVVGDGAILGAGTVLGDDAVVPPRTRLP